MSAGADVSADASGKSALNPGPVLNRRSDLAGYGGWNQRGPERSFVFALACATLGAFVRTGIR
jgi:hypothetical protein